MFTPARRIGDDRRMNKGETAALYLQEKNVFIRRNTVSVVREILPFTCHVFICRKYAIWQLFLLENLLLKETR